MKKIKNEMTSSLASYRVSTTKKNKSLNAESRLLAYIAAAATIAGGIFHLMMMGPSMKPYNFPMELLPYTDALFIVVGIAQIFWALPMIKNWGLRWYYVGMAGTIGLTILLALTRFPNEITGAALQDRNPMALLTEIAQLFYIGVTAIIITRMKISLIRSYAKSLRFDISKLAYP